MRKIDIDEQKKMCAQILHYVSDFCEKHGIQYTVAYGTLIGAIRHKGFIPWDDDIDILMTREEYNKFYNLFSKEDTGIYKIVSTENSSEYPFNFMKVHDTRTVLYEENFKKSYYGIYIDIFPLDYVPSDENERLNRISKIQKIYFLEAFKIRKRAKRSNVLKTIISDIVYLFLNFLPASFLCKMIDRMIKQCNDSSDKQYLENIASQTYYKKEKYPAKWFEKTQKMPFEDFEVNVTTEYDNVLKTVYGNYMEFPPVEQQVYRHGTTTYWKE
ncbi:hypothetical protein CXIVA_25380 [Clostridium sp. SY8519]|uniref:LicD family protein n=1 Tax=Clostridium sp. (strain SY8519) TaxID=1042156 RepID=UPI00021722CC|nr:LicD family protein [Clostridium sp. SY8519]BAK48506.1 hypothetical protein CXIVA_25380 [Clostridium sp. SY8519]